MVFSGRLKLTLPDYLNVCKKVKWSRYRPGVAQRLGRGIALLFHDHGTRRGEWSAARPGRTLPPGRTRYPFYRRLGGPQGRSGRAKNLIPTGIRSRTVQRVVSRYTDWATGPLKMWRNYCNFTKSKIFTREYAFVSSITHARVSYFFPPQDSCDKKGLVSECSRCSGTVISSLLSSHNVFLIR